jgi:GPI mannosyltransferase 3
VDRSVASVSAGIERDAGSPSRSAANHGAAVALAALVLFAIALRLVPVLLVPSLDWPDELFQATEQAHRLVFGTGLVPWEFQLDVRSWLLPGVIAAIMEAARAVGDGPDAYLPAIAITFAASAAAPVACCFLWCRRRFGVAAACAGGAVVAMAPDLVYLGGRTLSEVVAAHVMVIAMFVALPDPGEVRSCRQLIAGGALIALALVLRVQLAPALVLVAGLALVRARGRGVGALLVGGGGVLVIAALLDWITLGAPLASMWRYVIVNLLDGVSASNGVSPWDFYATWEFDLWSFALAAPLLLAAFGAWRMPMPLVAAAIIVAAHSVIAHKEYRFIYPAILLVMISAGLGLAQLASWAEPVVRRRFGAGPAAGAATASACWALMCCLVWTGPAFVVLRHVARDELRATMFVEHDPEACGVGLDLGLGERDWIYGGYSYLHRPVPRYWFKDTAELVATSPGFNTLISTRPPPAQLGYTPLQCFGDACVARRPGGCAAIPMKTLPLPDPLR